MATEYEKDSATFGFSDGQRDARGFKAVRERATPEEDSAAVLRSTAALISETPSAPRD